jgi:hypothetical protein
VLYILDDVPGVFGVELIVVLKLWPVDKIPVVSGSEVVSLAIVVTHRTTEKKKIIVNI